MTDNSESRKQWYHAVRYVMRSLGRKQWRDHERPFRYWFLRYCITPPAIPPHDSRNVSPMPMRGRLRPPQPRECLACGRWHITSEDCGIPEPRESRQGVTEMGTQMAFGYRLARAEGMGVFSEGVMP